ncbi:MAG TPA: OmpA family protein [Bryobacteraceae bacterium]|nr:OmpA family protein [Bryobacteraceae bacterium]
MKPTLLLLLFAFVAQPQSLGPDGRGCKDSAILSRFPGCRLLRCRAMQYNMHPMPVFEADGKTVKKQPVEGEFEELVYQCPRDISPIQLYRNTENALKAVGYNVRYTHSYFTTRYYLTAQKGPQWVNFSSEGSGYTLVMVKTKELEQVVKAGAEGWIEQINQNGKASIYGINFDTGKATIRPDSESVLVELATMLRKQPDWALVVAGHTDNAGSDTINVPLSRQRAEAVIASLAAKGIDKSRLVPAGFGSTRPVAPNDTEEGKAKNRRVDIVKLY